MQIIRDQRKYRLQRSLFWFGIRRNERSHRRTWTLLSRLAFQPRSNRVGSPQIAPRQGSPFQGQASLLWIYVMTYLVSWDERFIPISSALCQSISQISFAFYSMQLLWAACRFHGMPVVDSASHAFPIVSPSFVPLPPNKAKTAEDASTLPERILPIYQLAQGSSTWHGRVASQDWDEHFECS